MAMLRSSGGAREVIRRPARAAADADTATSASPQAPRGSPSSASSFSKPVNGKASPAAARSAGKSDQNGEVANGASADDSFGSQRASELEGSPTPVISANQSIISAPALPGPGLGSSGGPRSRPSDATGGPPAPLNGTGVRYAMLSCYLDHFL